MTTSTREVRVGGLKLWARFTLAMTLALALVMAVAGLFLYRSATSVAETVRERTLRGAVRLLAENPEWEQEGQGVTQFQDGITRTPVRYGPRGEPGYLYRFKTPDRNYDLIDPAGQAEAQRGLLGLILGVTLGVLVVAAGVSVYVAGQVSRPLDEIVTDIGHIASGNLRHRTRVRSGGEIALLARSIDRMAKNLQEAQETELELSVRERERAVAAEVREALLPQTTPQIEGYELGAGHMGSDELNGDFHDFIELPDGRVGLLVCDVSGAGLPGALVGATARAYLRRELEAGDDVADRLRRVNRELVKDVRRGMFVSALYAEIEPRQGVATVACAGHKLPLVRFSADDGKLRLVQPEGISLGFDRGPIFDSRLEVQRVAVERGDRLVLANTGAVAVTNAAGNELGEKAFYGQVLRAAVAHPSGDAFLQALEAVLRRYAGESGFTRDVSIVTISRT